MSKLIELWPQHTIDFRLVNIDDHVVTSGYQGWYEAVESALECLDNAEPTVVQMDGPQELTTHVLPTTCLDGLGIDPYVLTTFQLNARSAGAIALFGEPEYWFVGNDVLAVLNAVVDEMEHHLVVPTDVSCLSFETKHFTTFGANFELFTTFDGVDCTLQFAIERLSSYRTRRLSVGLPDRFDKFPRSFDQMKESFLCFANDFIHVHTISKQTTRL